MRPDLRSVLETLRAHEADLRGMGVSHAAVFGSVARGGAGAGSDIDVMVELDDNRPMGIFEYAGMKLYINGILDGPSDIVNRRTLKPLIREYPARRGSCLLRIPPSDWPISWTI
jgi:predicted nucleotidyltransferase